MVLTTLSLFLLITLSYLYLEQHCVSGDEQDVKESGGYSSYKLNDDAILKYEVLSNKMIWKDAKVACQKKGMVLAYADSSLKYFILTKFVRENNYTPEYFSSGYWVGGYRNTDTGMLFKWENGRTISSSRWLIDEPNDNEKENCIELNKKYWTMEQLGWDNIHCDSLRKSICMKETHSHEEGHKNETSMSEVPEERIDAEKHKIENAMLHHAEIRPHVEKDPMYDDAADDDPSLFSSRFRSSVPFFYYRLHLHHHSDLTPLHK